MPPLFAEHSRPGVPDENPPSTAPLWLCLVKLARLRYLQFAVVPATIGFLSTGNRSGAALALGFAAAFCWFIVTEYTNMVADRVEDAIDYRERTALCRRVGYGRLAVVAVGAGGAYVALVSVMLALSKLTLALYLVALVGVGLTVNYSVGVRVKTRSYASVVLMGAYQAAFLLAGWMYGHTNGDGSAREAALCSALLLGFGVTLVGWKDLPSLEGDARVGYTSLYWRVVAGRHAVARARMVLALPLLGIVVLVAAGLLPARYLLLLLLSPLALAAATVIARARTLTERQAAREFGTMYLLASMNAGLVVLYPRLVTVAIVLAGSASYVLFGTTLHPDPAEVVSSTQRAAVAGMLWPSRKRDGWPPAGSLL
jgi:hypothetical protein